MALCLASGKVLKRLAKQVRKDCAPIVAALEQQWQDSKKYAPQRAR